MDVLRQFVEQAPPAQELNSVFYFPPKDNLSRGPMDRVRKSFKQKACSPKRSTRGVYDT